MINDHEQRYAHCPQQDRLQQLDLSIAQYHRLQSTLAERVQRECRIPDADVQATIEHFIAHPQSGAQKTHLSLIDSEQAMISSTFCNEIKQQLAALALTESERRRVDSVLEKDLQARLAEKKKQQQFQQLHAEAPHDIWATDFLHLSVFGRSLYVCMTYDVYSQNYLALRAGEAPDRTLAKATVEAAAQHTDCRPRHYLLHDNGKPFLCADYKQLLARLSISEQATPPGCPWFNGSLESGNTSLRATILTVGIQDLAVDPRQIRRLRADLAALVAKVQQFCNRALTVLNKVIARPKFRTVPQTVLDDKVPDACRRHQAFVQRKNAQRDQRMAAIRDGTLKPQHKTLTAKINAAAKRCIKILNNEQLHALTELLQGRFALLSI